MPSHDEHKPADWEKWGDMVSAELWKAVALSLDIEPESLSIEWRDADYSDPFEDCPREFRRRIAIAVNHAVNGALRLRSHSSGLPWSTVRLSDFADWVGSRGWGLPDQFPRRPVSLNVSSAGGSDSAHTDAPTRRAGIRTNKAEAAERACEEWFGGLTERPENKDAAFFAAVAACTDIGPLSRKAFDRAWANKAPAEWKKSGRRKRS